jgi:hypothetical protein
MGNNSYGSGSGSSKKTISGPVGNGPTTKKTIPGPTSSATSGKKTIPGPTNTTGLERKTIPGPTRPAQTQTSGGDCFVATAAFGSPLAFEIQILRDFRDQTLRRTSFGRKFISFYYQCGPHLAKLVRKSPMVKATIRGLVKLSISIVKRSN